MKTRVDLSFQVDDFEREEATLTSELALLEEEEAEPDHGPGNGGDTNDGGSGSAGSLTTSDSVGRLLAANKSRVAMTRTNINQNEDTEYDAGTKSLQASANGKKRAAEIRRRLEDVRAGREKARRGITQEEETVQARLAEYRRQLEARKRSAQDAVEEAKQVLDAGLKRAKSQADKLARRQAARSRRSLNGEGQEIPDTGEDAANNREVNAAAVKARAAAEAKLRGSLTLAESNLANLTLKCKQLDKQTALDKVTAEALSKHETELHRLEQRERNILHREDQVRRETIAAANAAAEGQNKRQQAAAEGDSVPVTPQEKNLVVREVELATARRDLEQQHEELESSRVALQQAVREDIDSVRRATAIQSEQQQRELHARHLEELREMRATVDEQDAELAEQRALLRAQGRAAEMETPRERSRHLEELKKVETALREREAELEDARRQLETRAQQQVGPWTPISYTTCSR